MFYDIELISNFCNTYIVNNELVLYKNQYYINLLSKGTIKPSFPDYYDELIICHDDVKVSFQKLKEIDRFTRKSRAIYKDINNLDDNYLLVFRYDNNDVYRVFYNDIAYPDSAVEIMTSKILKPYCN